MAARGIGLQTNFLPVWEPDMDRLTSLTAFKHAAESGSFSGAGRVLGISGSAVGKSIARLEARLGVRLLHRSTRSIALTEYGERFYEKCVRICGELKAAEQELENMGGRLSGRLRIGLPVSGLRFASAIGRFAKLHQDLQVEFDVCDRPFEMIENGIDVAFRFGEIPDSTLISRTLIRFRRTIVAAPSYLTQNGIPQIADDLHNHVCLHQRSLTTGKPERWPARDETGTVVTELPVMVTASTAEALIAMAVDGIGIACVPTFMVGDHLVARRLSPVLPQVSIEALTLRLLWLSNRYVSPKIKAFIDYMSSYVKTCPFLDGNQLREFPAVQPHQHLRFIPLATDQTTSSRLLHGTENTAVAA